MRRVRRAALLAALSSSACGEPGPDSPGAAQRPAAAAFEETARRGDVPAVAAPAPSVPDARKGTWVLHIGDSFLSAWFAPRLAPRMRALGVLYVPQGEDSTFTTGWASDERLDKWLAHRPALVLVTLGANEVELPRPEEHAIAVKRIARKIADAKASCVWTTPPLWKRDTGFMQVIHDSCGPCLFFDSDAVLGGLGDDERQRDRIHPNERGGTRWAGAFWQWMEDHRDPSRGAWALEPFERRSL